MRKYRKITTIITLLLILGFFITPPDLCAGDCECEDEGPYKQAKLSGITFVSGEKAFMYIVGEIQYQDGYIYSDINVLREQTQIRDIEVLFNSYGGDAFAAFAIVDLINLAEKTGFRFKAYGTGVIASAAVAVFLACDERVAGPGAMFMVHEASSSMSGTSSQFRAHNNILELLRERYFEILITETSIKDREKWEEWERKTEWFNANTALERGLIQKIE